MKQPKKVSFTFKIPETLHRSLRIIAAKSDRKINEVATEAVEQYCDLVQNER